MRDVFEQIPACAIDLGKRDEHAAQIVSAPPPQSQKIQVLVELLGRLLRGPLGHVPRGRDEVVRAGHAAIGALPAGQLPLGKDAGKG
ncbi:MAG: hypothetical protein ABSB49_05050 [Polyangia bacterium]